MADDNHDIAIGDIIAAMLSEKHPLSAEDLKAFETLLDGPDVDDAARLEYLQVIWSIVVGIIDHRWKTTATTSDAGACGQKSQKGNSEQIEADNMLQSKNGKLSKSYKQASGKEQLSRGAA